MHRPNANRTTLPVHAWKCPICKVELRASVRHQLRQASDHHWQSQHPEQSRKKFANTGPANVAVLNSRRSRALSKMRGTEHDVVAPRSPVPPHKQVWTCKKCTAVDKSSTRFVADPCSWQKQRQAHQRWTWWQNLSKSQQQVFRKVWNCAPPSQRPTNPSLYTPEQMRMRRRLWIRENRRRKREGTFVDLRTGGRSARAKASTRRIPMPPPPVPTRRSQTTPTSSCSRPRAQQSTSVIPAMPAIHLPCLVVVRPRSARKQLPCKSSSM